MRNAFEYFRAFNRHYATDNRRFAKTRLPMPLLVIEGDQSMNGALEAQAHLISGNVKAIKFTAAGHRPMEERPANTARVEAVFGGELIGRLGNIESGRHSHMTCLHVIDYANMVSKIYFAGGEMPFAVLVEELEREWLRQYAEMTPRVKNICGQVLNGFEYVYDDYASLEKTGTVPVSAYIESRVVYVHGRSVRATDRRRMSRQRGWVGPTEKYLGADTDKGHFMAHSIGGGLEINIFAQNRSINRGWSPRGTVYRKMERYCFDNPGTYCFSRPIYSDLTSRPQSIDFGLLRPDGSLWVERFENN